MTVATAQTLEPEAQRRRDWLSLLAKSDAAQLAALWASFEQDAQPHSWLRAPEFGGVMVQGRMGGTGDAFNLGEMTVTRCSLTLSDGTVGHGYVQGRGKAHATHAALVDAHMQTDLAARLDADLLSPLRAAKAGAKARRAAKAAATKVDFFTLVRGED